MTARNTRTPSTDQPVTVARTISTWSRHGQRREHGRLPAPDGPLALAPGLATPGQVPFAEAAALVAAAWQQNAADGLLARLTADKMINALERLTAFATANGVARLADLDDALVEEWVFSRLKTSGTRRGRAHEAGKPPESGTLHFRRGFVRQFSQTCRLLGLDNRHLAADLPLPRRSDRIPVPLTDTEMQACRDNAAFSTRATLLPSVLALSCTGASTAEVAMAEVCDIRLEDRLVWVHGGNRRTFERWLPLDEWMLPILERRITRLTRTHADYGDRASLTYKGKPTAPYDRKQSAICNSLRRILYLADVTRPGVRPTSFSEWVAVSTFTATGRVEAVAARLGLVSLDRAGHLVGYDWLDSHLTPAPAGAFDPALADDFADTGA